MQLFVSFLTDQVFHQERIRLETETILDVILIMVNEARGINCTASLMDTLIGIIVIEADYWAQCFRRSLLLRLFIF